MTAAPPPALPPVPPPGHLRVAVTYLEMDAPPAGPPPGPRADVELLRVRPTVRHYRYLFDAIGEPWLWHGRRTWAPERLAAWLASPAAELWVPHVEGTPAGMAELDRSDPEACELAYFGLMPEFIGRGLGPWLLGRAVRIAFEGGARRMTVNTCTLDHPSALRMYEAAGFRPVRRVERDEPDPRLTGVLPPTAGPHVPLAAGPLPGLSAAGAGPG